MKKKVLKSVLPILCVAFTVAGFAACNDGEEHVHTYSTEWSKDAEGHWYDVTCDCADAPENPKLQHVDKNNDSLCDICEYDYGHAHTYETETWTVNCEQHWRAATCGHVVVGTEVGDHADEDADGKCDTCNYVIEDIHEHVFDDEWTSDGGYHWYAALCEHKDEISGKEAHNLNAAGDCTVCGAHINDVDATNIEAVLAAAQANNYKIAYGDVIATEAVYGGTGAQTLENGKTNRVHFALGNGESYIQYISFDKDGNYIGQEEQWFEDLGNGEVFGAAMLDGEYELSPIAGAAQFLNGYNYIPGSILPSSSNDTSTLANLLVGLYNQMKANVRVKDATESVEDGVYKFAYTYYSVNVQKNTETANGDGTGDITGQPVYNVELELYKVVVEFTVNADMIIDSADFQVEVYRDYSNNQGGVEVGDPDLEYEWKDNGDGTVTIGKEVDGEFVEAYPELKATANPSFYTYSVAQTAGERTFTTPYPRNALIPTGFEFEYVLETAWNEDYTQQIATKTEKVGDVYEILAGEYAKFVIGDVLPKTASSKFFKTEDFTYSFVNNDPNSTARAWYDSDTILNGYTPLSQMLKLKIRDIGEYTVTLACGDVKKVFTLKVVNEKPIVLPEDTPTTVNVATTDTHNWEQDLYSYTASEADTYTFTVPAGLGIQKKGEATPLVDYYDNANGTNIEVELAADEKFEFYVAATTKGAWVINVTKGVVEKPEPEVLPEKALSLEADGNAISESNLKYTYTATEEGTLNLFFSAWINGSNPSMSYSINGDDAVVIEAGVDAFLTLYAYDQVEITVLANGGYATLFASWEATQSGGGDETATLEDSVLGWYDSAIGVYNIGLYKDTETSVYTFNVYTDGVDLYYSYVAEKNNDDSLTLTLTFLSDHWMNSSATDTLGLDGKEITATPNGDSWTFSGDIGSGEGGGDGGDETATLEDSLAGYYDNAIGSYSIGFYKDSETSVYYMNVYGTGFDFYYTYEVTENTDGTLTIVPTFVPDHWMSSSTTETIGVAGKEITATPNGDSWTFSGDIGSGEGGGDEGDEGETTEPDGSETNPYVVADGVSIVISADYFNPIFVKVPAGVTASIDTGAKFYTDPTDMSSAVGTSVTPDVETVYIIYSDTYAGAMCMLTGGTAGSGEESGLEGSGTDADPFVIPVMGDYTCAFPGGMGYVFYSYTPSVAGTFTVTILSSDYYWGMGTDLNLLENFANALATYSMSVAANQTMYVAVATYSGEAGDVEFAVAFEESASAPVADGSAANPFALEENNTCEFAGGNGFVFYTYTAEVAGTLTVTVTSADYFWAYGSDEYSLENVGGTIPSVEIAVAAGETVLVGMSTYSMQAGTITFTATFVEGTAGGDEGSEDGGEDTPTVSYDTVIVEGANTLYFSAAEVSANAAERKVTITTPGNYSFNAGNLFVAGVLDSANTAITKAADYTYALPAGEYTVQFGMLSMFGVSADTACTLNLVWKSELVVEETPDAGEDSGSEGGEVGTAAVYLGVHASGRKYQVTISGNTITVVKSDMTGNFTGGATTNTGTIDGATEVVLANCKVYLENGAPTRVVWAQHDVSGFELQA